MANTVITPSNSLTSQLFDADASRGLLVTEGGYISTILEDAYYARGNNTIVTVKGSIVARFANGIVLGETEGDSVDRGYNEVVVAAGGIVQGTRALYILGDYNKVYNSGAIVSTPSSGYGIYFDGGSNKITNSGSISAYYGIYSNDAYIDIRNSGTIDCTTAILSGSSTDLINTGTIFGNIIVFSGSLKIDNDGIINGNISSSAASDGNDVVDTSGGTIAGLVNLGGGSDAYLGGIAVDRVFGGLGNDDIDLGAGNDAYRAENGDGKDILDGGDGIDRYDASYATQAVTVDLSANITAGTVGADSIVNFEDITGGAAADTLTGDDGANRIDGGMGADTLSGGAGGDRLIGGTGTDTITGGAGRDVLTGGLNSGSLDSDTFVYRTGDSGVTAATRDTISDFTDHGSNAGPFATGADLIDLHLIDANTGTAGDQAFSFNATKGAAFSGSAGSLIWQQFTGFALISGDTNGDKVADFTIQLNGTHTLFASDFVL